MMWIRRIFAFPFLLLFVFAFAPLLIVSRVQSTLLNPAFYVEQSRKAQVFHFLHDRLLPAALDDLDEYARRQYKPLNIRQNFTAPICRLARQAMPPEWMQQQAEIAIFQFASYLLQDAHRFSLSIEFKSRILALQQGIRELLQDHKTCSEAYNLWIDFLAGSVHENWQKNAAEVQKVMSQQEVQEMLKALFPQEWTIAMLAQANEQFWPYLTGEREHFTIHIDCLGFTRAASQFLARIVGKIEAYDYMLSLKMAPAIASHLSQNLPFGITLSEAEALALAREIMPQPWFKEQMTKVIEQTFAYLDGSAETLAVTIPLAERKQAMAAALDKLVNARLQEAWLSLPESQSESTESMLEMLRQGKLPSHRPAGMSYEEAKRSLNLDFGQAFSDAMAEQVADQFHIAQEHLDQSLQSQGNLSLGELRQHIKQGIILTDAKWQEALDDRGRQDLAKAREVIRTGLSLSEADLRRDMSKRQERELEEFRYGLRVFRNSLPIAWLLLLCTLAFSAVLCANTTPGKITWAAVLVSIGAVLAIIITLTYTGIVYPTLEMKAVQDIELNATPNLTNTTSVYTQKVCDTIRLLGDSFAQGIRAQSIAAIVLAILAIVLPGVFRRHALAAGAEQGRADDRKAIVLHALQQGIDAGTIHKVTGIPPEEIEQIRKN